MRFWTKVWLLSLAVTLGLVLYMAAKVAALMVLICIPLLVYVAMWPRKPRK